VSAVRWRGRIRQNPYILLCAQESTVRKKTMVTICDKARDYIGLPSFVSARADNASDTHQTHMPAIYESRPFECTYSRADDTTLARARRTRRKPEKHFLRRRLVLGVQCSHTRHSPQKVSKFDRLSNEPYIMRCEWVRPHKLFLPKLMPPKTKRARQLQRARQRSN
jgi:hypothetical protein